MTSKFKPEDQVYKYKLVSFVNRGAFGELWKAWDAAIDSEVALKIIPIKEKALVRNLLNEAKNGHKFEHKNLVKILYADVVKFNEEDYVLIVQDFMENGNINGQVNSRGFINWVRAMVILKDVLEGLDWLHCREFLHNDIKPSNILLGPNGEAKLTDYGISVPATDGSGYSDLLYSAHRAPEISKSASGLSISVQSDIYQLGCTGYRLLNDINSIVREKSSLAPVEFEKKRVAGKIPDLKNFKAFVPKKVQKIIRKACHIDISKRYKTALEMKRDIEKIDLYGFWDVDQRGDFIGMNKNWEYRFEKTLNPNGLLFHQALKKNLSSSNEFRVKEYCKKNLSIAQFEKLNKDYFQFVIEKK